MHEVALAQELLSLIERVALENRARQVTVAALALGELSCVEPTALSFAFELASRGTLAEGCRLEIERTPLVVYCAACGHEGPAGPDALGCPACEHVPVEVRAGREMRLVSIDVEDGDPLAGV
jgi:hydrogenase nickel incorporation protein HypA/HybF